MNNKEFSVLLTDFDETITRNKKISQQTRELLDILKQNGLIDLMIISTGRSIESFIGAKEKYTIDFYDYVICSNGAIILDRNNKILLSYHMLEHDKQVVETIISDFSRSIDKVIVSSTHGDIFSLNYIMKNRLEAENMSQKINNLETDIYAINTTIYVDVMSKNADKWRTYRALMTEILKINKFYTFSLGDGNNDKSILLNADYSYSFKHGANIAKENVDKISINIENALSEIIAIQKSNKS